MLTFYNGWDGSLDELRRQMAQLFDEFDTVGFTNPSLFGGAQVWPRVNLADNGSELVITADVPGLSEKDIDVSLEKDVLTIAGERKTTTPAGYTAHRRERESFRFTRSFNLPYRVQSEKATATVKQGVLTIALPKIPEARPKRIEIRGS
jgi:HSP20 family protein